MYFEGIKVYLSLFKFINAPLAILLCKDVILVVSALVLAT